MTTQENPVCKISGEKATHAIICDGETVYGAGEDNVIKLAGKYYAQKKKPNILRLENLAVLKQLEKVNKANVGTGKADYDNTSRALDDAKKLDDSGFSKPNTFFAVGTPLASSGVDAFRRERAKFDKLPLLKEGCESFVKRIESENRNDVIISLNELKANDDFSLTVPGIGNVFLANPEILASMIAYSPCTANTSKYLSKCPGHLRAQNVNYWTGVTQSDRKVRLRLRERNDLKEVFSVLTETYTPLDADKVATLITEEAPKGARVEIIYDGFSTRIQALYHTNVDPKSGVVGEVFKAGSSLKTNDAGGGAIYHRSIAWRALCLNFTNMMTSLDIGYLKHIGDVDKLRKKVRFYLQESFNRIIPFAEAWVKATNEDIINTAVPIERDDPPLTTNNVYNSIMNIFAGTIQRELVPLKARKDEAVLKLMEMWEKEPAPTRTGIVNAYTRYAHEEEQSSPWDEDDIQDGASDLLYSNKPLPYTNAAKWLLEK